MPVERDIPAKTMFSAELKRRNLLTMCGSKQEKNYTRAVNEMTGNKQQAISRAENNNA